MCGKRSKHNFIELGEMEIDRSLKPFKWGAKMNPLPDKKKDFEFWAYRLRQNERRVWRSINEALRDYGQVHMSAYTKYNHRGLVISQEDFDYAAQCVTPQVLSRVGPSIGNVKPGFCLAVPELFYIHRLDLDDNDAYERRVGWHSDEKVARYSSMTQSSEKYYVYVKKSQI